jgi:hypothetical protein
VLHTLEKFGQNGHLNPDLFDVFIRDKVYMRFAGRFVDVRKIDDIDDIDDIDESQILGYVP